MNNVMDILLEVGRRRRRRRKREFDGEGGEVGEKPDRIEQ